MVGGLGGFCGPAEGCGFLALGVGEGGIQGCVGGGEEDGDAEEVGELHGGV